jgi:hypothetical protein
MRKVSLFPKFVLTLLFITEQSTCGILQILHKAHHHAHTDAKLLLPMRLQSHYL